MSKFVTRFLSDDQGADLIEYALLAAFIGTVGIVAWQSIGTGIFNAYEGWDGGVQKLYSPPDPGGGS